MVIAREAVRECVVHFWSVGVAEGTPKYDEAGVNIEQDVYGRTPDILVRSCLVT
jgi:hypothetical protein